MERTTYTVRYVPYEETTSRERGESLVTLNVGGMKYMVFSNCKKVKNWDSKLLIELRMIGFNYVEKNPGSTITLETTVKETISTKPQL